MNITSTDDSESVINTSLGNTSNFTNSSGPETPTQDRPFHTCFIYSIFTTGVLQGLLYVIAFVGNLLCFAVWNKIGRSKGNNSSLVLMQSLALSDFFSQIWTLVLTIVPYVIFFSGSENNPFIVYYFPYLARYLAPIASVAYFGTVWTTCLIAVHRFQVLNKPFSSVTRCLTSVRSTLGQICCIFVVAIGWQIPKLLAEEIKHIDRPTGETVPRSFPTALGLKYSYNLYYNIVARLVVLNVAPMSICLVFTIRILILLARAKKSRKNMTTTEKGKEAEITKMLLVVVILYIVCQLPNTMLYCYIAFKPDFRISCGDVAFYIYPFTYLLVSLNSSINIFVYMICNQEFRRTLKSMCCCANARNGGSLRSSRANVAANVTRGGTNAENSVHSSKTSVSAIDTSL